MPDNGSSENRERAIEAAMKALNLNPSSGSHRTGMEAAIAAYEREMGILAQLEAAQVEIFTSHWRWIKAVRWEDVVRVLTNPATEG